MVGVLEWFTDRAQRKQREEWMGQPASLLEPNGPGLPGDTQNYGITPGTGLLGGQMTPAQYEVMLSTQTGPQARTWMNNQMANRGAMQRQMQEQDYYGENMTAYNRAQIEQQVRANAIASSKMGMDIGFKQREFITKANQDHRKTVDQVEKMNRALPRTDKGGLDVEALTQDRARQYQYVVTAAKSILGNEAVMADNERGIVNLSQNAPPMLLDLVNRFNNGKLDSAGILQLIKMANDNAAYHDDQIRQNRASIGEPMQPYLLPYSGLTQPEYPEAAPAAAPGRGTTNIQTPQPVTRMPGT